MDRENITKLAYEKMGKAKAHIAREKGFIYYHGLRTAKLALTLRKNIFPEINEYDDFIFVGALFHDCGKGLEPHEESGEVLVRHFLKNHFLEEELNIISDIVKFHRDRKSPNDHPMWIKLVQDADILEHQGTTEVWINIAYTLYDEKSYDRAIEWWLEDEKCLKGKVKQRKKLNFDFSKKVWDEKLEYVDSFIKRLKEESEGNVLFK